eukprot:CAMPEP_0173272766 /NCGR_PEP_ID=MMETSP1143-20121109/1540_1 /TAXON_ID=483371 /ORGANISM="non described non described, Strain CCMP2298" /LENGTH=103 /DNA_ID=CAMNT_0014209449 /DNA_START=488 /DNA_END=796 /DNA_ORIENTATION=-
MNWFSRSSRFRAIRAFREACILWNLIMPCEKASSSGFLALKVGLSFFGETAFNTSTTGCASPATASTASDSTSPPNLSTTRPSLSFHFVLIWRPNSPLRPSVP